MSYLSQMRPVAFKPASRVSLASLFLSVCMLLLTGLPGEAASVKCPKEGNVTVQIENRTFTVLRLVLRRVGALGDEKEQSYYCDAAEEVRGANFFINVTSTRAGDAFNKQWRYEKRLPPSILITLRKSRLKFHIDDALRLRNDFFRNTGDQTREGFQEAENAPEIYYYNEQDGPFGFDKRSIAFSCFKEPVPRGGRNCDTSYPFDDVIAIRYSFNDYHFPKESWVALDARVREYIVSIMKKN